MSETTYPLESTHGQDVGEEPVLPGPHFCNETGARVLEKISQLFYKACEHNNGSLTRADLDTLFNFIRNSNDMSEIYASSYNHCMSACGQYKHVTFTKGLFAKYVFDTMLSRLVKAIFQDQLHLGGRKWRNVFAYGFLAALTRFIDPEIEDKLYPVYLKLSRTKGRSLTKRDILLSPEIVNILIQIFAVVQQMIKADSHLLSNFCNVINFHMKIAFDDGDFHLHYVSPGQLEKMQNLIVQRM